MLDLVEQMRRTGRDLRILGGVGDREEDFGNVTCWLVGVFQDFLDLLIDLVIADDQRGAIASAHDRIPREADGKLIEQLLSRGAVAKEELLEGARRHFIAAFKVIIFARDFGIVDGHPFTLGLLHLQRFIDQLVENVLIDACPRLFVRIAFRVEQFQLYPGIDISL